MRRIRLFEGVLSILFCACTAALAHPPSALQLAFDPAQHMLQITVMHDTKNPAEHFIKTITVHWNGKEIVKQEFASQQDKDKQAVSYRIDDARPGDELAVTGVCNVFGKRKGTIRINSGGQP